MFCLQKVPNDMILAMSVICLHDFRAFYKLKMTNLYIRGTYWSKSQVQIISIIFWDYNITIVAFTLRQNFEAKLPGSSWVTKISSFSLDTGRKLNVHKTFRRRLGHLLNVLCTFSLRPVSTGLWRRKLSSTLPSGHKKVNRGYHSCEVCAYVIFFEYCDFPKMIDSLFLKILVLIHFTSHLSNIMKEQNSSSYLPCFL